MKPKLLLKVIALIFGLLIFVIFSKNVKAAEGECANLPCFVPAPTIVFPTQNATTTNPRPVISGLTWKTTKVEIYVDDVLLKNITLVKHEDYYASFAAKLDKDLTPGKHYVYAFAIDENNGWGGVSKESTHTKFVLVVEKKKVITKAVTYKTPVNKEENKETSKPYDVISSTSTTKIIDEDNIGNVLNEAPIAKVAEVPPVKIFDNIKNIFENFQKSRQVSVDVNNNKSQPELKVVTSTNQQISGGTQEKTDFNNNEDEEISNINKVDDYQKRLKTNRVVGFIILAGIALISLFWLLLREPLFKEEAKLMHVEDESEQNTDVVKDESDEINENK